MMDIDNFKLINDTYGHLCGDELLKELSSILKENTKAQDKKIRYAGDEFTIILPATNYKDVLVIAERLVTKINSYRFKDRRSQREFNVTISIGVSGFPKDSSIPIELVELADKSLYFSKQKEKSRIVCLRCHAGIYVEKRSLKEIPLPGIFRQKKRNVCFAKRA